MDLSIDRSTQKKETTKPWKRSVFKGFHAICPHFKLMQKENYPSCEVIIVKKFGLFVECKACKDIEQELCFNCADARNQFGINAIAVLVTDVQEGSSSDHASDNAMHRESDAMKDEVIIWKPDEIDNIGHTLLRVINGNYKNKGREKYV